MTVLNEEINKALNLPVGENPNDYYMHWSYFITNGITVSLKVDLDGEVYFDIDWVT